MERSKKILLVDDEPDILEPLSYNFLREGFEVRTAGDGVSAVRTARAFIPDVIIMDIMMPEMDGIEACREIRKSENCRDTLIVLLSARKEDYSQIAGFEAGSDDYLVKPVRTKLLISRINAILRRRNRYRIENHSKRINENLVINRDNYTVRNRDREILLPRKEFEILSLIASKPNRLFRREEIFNQVWGTETFVGGRTLDVYIRKLRSKIGENHIKTIKGVGYKYLD